MVGIDTCFVVMPFGIKPKNDGTNGTYNFDKVYRVIIQRAIKNASMKPLRADETEGNRIIHADMFKDLRDRPVVLVDLSLLNPNVMYELGIRHVMSPTGTVLMANEETIKKLPFDIALSRTIPYKFDGDHLDWDEVERVVPLLQTAIEEAKGGSPDSPIYAFLEDVLSSNAVSGEDIFHTDEDRPSTSLNDYQEQIARIWLEQPKKDIEDLIRENSNSSFGARCVGYYAKKADFDDKSLLKAAKFSLNQEQYDLAADLYERLEKNKGGLSIGDMYWYSQAVAFRQPDLNGASKGLEINKNALKAATKKINENLDNLDAKKDFSYANQQIAEMLEWKWSLSREKEDLDNAITGYREAIRLMEELQLMGVPLPLGRYAQNLICHTMLLRIADGDRHRPDIEKNFQKVLQLKPAMDENHVSASNLRWYQIFILADMGRNEDIQKRSTIAMSEDMKIAGKKVDSQVGRRQYTKLRRFIERYSDYWRDTTLVARVSQILKATRMI